MGDVKNGYQATPNATLEQQGDTCPTCGSECNERDELTKAEREIERLRAEIEALRADAERYRWLRDGSNPPWVMQMLERYADNGSDFDAEVDAAIDLTTNQAVDAMDVLRARRALEGGE